MKEPEYLNSDVVHAFVDDQLDPDGRKAVVLAMDRDPELQERINRLRRTKDLMQVGFGAAVAPTRDLPRQPGTWPRVWAVAASILVLIGSFGAGVVGYFTGPGLYGQGAGDEHPALLSQSDRVVLHIAESDPASFSATLAQAERLLEEFRHTGGQVEVVANAGGLDLLRKGVSPYEQRVLALMQAYDNIHFIACANAIRNLRRRGERAEVIQEVKTDRTAVEHIVGRIQAGWRYIKVGTASEI